MCLFQYSVRAFRRRGGLLGRLRGAGLLSRCRWSCLDQTQDEGILQMKWADRTVVVNFLYWQGVVAYGHQSFIE
jgi:hypothetical protein